MTLHAVDDEKFAEVALRYLTPLLGAARRLTRNSADAEDLVQETYNLAFQHHRQLRDLAQCRAWLYRILRRQVVTRFRRESCRPTVAEDESSLDLDAVVTSSAAFDDVLADYVTLREIRAVIALLPDDLREALILCDVEGFSYAEIASIARCPVGTVRSRIARARAQLMRKLRTHADECGITRAH